MTKMTVSAKICGIRDETALDAAVAGGARFAGLVFYPPSPRYVTPDAAARLTSKMRDRISLVGLVVDADDSVINSILDHMSLDFLQCHGKESPSRVAKIKVKFGLPVIKAISIGGWEDVDQAKEYEADADWLLFDAKPPKSMTNALPGGNALAFDWALIANHTWKLPWILSGGLNANNVAEAIEISGAQVVDVSSGVENRPGVKSPARIKSFLDAAQAM